MKLFNKKKSDDSRARRMSRLRILRIREFGLLAGVLTLAIALGFAEYHGGYFKKIGNWTTQQILASTANAGFKVKDILVTGRTQIPSDVLLARLSIKENMPIFGVSLGDAQKSLADIPWIREASISRRLPDQIIVDLKERTPAAFWQHQQKISLIDRDGVVLTTHDLGAWQQLPIIVGAGAPEHMTELLGLLNAEPALAADLAAAIRVGGRRWDLRLKNGITVKLPEQDQELALRRLMALEEQKNILGRDITCLDLRQPEKILVTPVTGDDVKKNKKSAQSFQPRHPRLARESGSVSTRFIDSLYDGRTAFRMPAQGGHDDHV